MGFLKRLFRRPHTGEEIADAVTHVIAKDAFIHVRDKELKSLISAYPMSAEEREMIGVELELGGVVYAYLLLESLVEHVEVEKTKESFRTIKNLLTDAFVRYIKRGKEGGPLKREMLVQVIAARCEDCRKSFLRVKHQMEKEDLKRNFWTEFCAQDTLNHLVGKYAFQPSDELLFSNLARWNMRLGNEIQKAIISRSKVSSLK